MNPLFLGMIDKSSVLKSQGSLYLEFIPEDGLFHKMLLLSLMEFQLVGVSSKGKDWSHDIVTGHPTKS